MAIKLYKGKTKFMWLPVTTSTAISINALVGWSSGRLVPANNTMAGSAIMGTIRHAIASTDSDYATARLVEVQVPVEKNVVWECDVTTAAALTSTDQGEFHDLTTTDDGTGVATGSSSIDVAFCVGFISATKGLYILNIGPESLGVAAD